MTTPTEPHNREAEEAVIGSVLINPEVYYELAQFLKASDFYIVRNRYIWEAFTSLSERKVHIDTLTLTTELESADRLAEIRGQSYITELLANVPTSMNAEAYGHMVETESIRRQMITAANKIATLAYNQSVGAEELAAESASYVQLATPFARQKKKTIAELVTEHRQEISQLSKTPGAHIGILTRLTDLDRMLGFGIQKVFMTLAGRPGHGKTSLSMQIALEAVKQGKTVAFFSLEMSAKRITNVIMSILTEIDSQRLKMGKLTAEEWEKYNKAADYLTSMKNKFIIDAVSYASVQTIRSKCLALKSVGSLDLVIIDYLMKIKGYDKSEQHDKANFLTGDLSSLQLELDTALLLIHHTSRGIEHRGDGQPQLSDLNEGGERDPDVVMFLHPPKDITQSSILIPMRLSIEKNRDGPIGPVDLLFDAPCTTFKNAALRYVTLKAEDK
jgi:replicative DNA helicase